MPLGGVAHDVFDVSIGDVHGTDAGKYLIPLFLQSGRDGHDLGCGKRHDSRRERRRSRRKRDALLFGGRREVREIRAENGGGWELELIEGWELIDGWEVEFDLDPTQLVSALLPLLQDTFLRCHEKLGSRRARRCFRRRGRRRRRERCRWSSERGGVHGLSWMHESSRGEDQKGLYGNI